MRGHGEHPPLKRARLEGSEQSAAGSTDASTLEVTAQRAPSLQSMQQDDLGHDHSRRVHIGSPCGTRTSMDTAMSESREHSTASIIAITLPPFSSLSSRADADLASASARSVSAYEAGPDVLRSLQHQLSSRDHTIAALKRGQEQLQALLSRTQARFEASEIKNQISEREVVALNEAKLRLAQHNEELRAHVEELTRQKQELERQVVADGAQWRQIMSMSSRLQLQSADEARRFTAERQQWTEEREQLVMRVNQLTMPAAGLEYPTQPVSRSTQSEPIVADERQTANEISSLRQRCREQEEILTSLVEGSKSMERMTRLLLQARQQLNSGS